jgi:hypothetical protein
MQRCYVAGRKKKTDKGSNTRAPRSGIKRIVIDR